MGYWSQREEKCQGGLILAGRVILAGRASGEGTHEIETLIPPPGRKEPLQLVLLLGNSLRQPNRIHELAKALELEVRRRVPGLELVRPDEGRSIVIGRLLVVGWCRVPLSRHRRRPRGPPPDGFESGRVEDEVSLAEGVPPPGSEDRRTRPELGIRNQ